MRPVAHSPPPVVVMVGLPARGKTAVARRIARYLSWLGVNARVFNVGNYRRDTLGAQQPHSFFDPTNPEGRAARKKVALAALEDMQGWLASGGEVALYDATNSTRARRSLLLDALKPTNAKVLFVESICDDMSIIDHNIRQTKLRSPDYAGVDPDKAVADFLARIAHYEAAYETITDESLSFVKMIDVGRRLEVNRIDGYLPARLVTFLLNIHIAPRRIWLTRHGESRFNAAGRIGGDAPLTQAGEIYAESLPTFIEAQTPDRLRVITSTLQRTQLTARHLQAPKEAWPTINEIDAGRCDGWTYGQIERELPEEFKARKADKLNYRYPSGESYLDLIERLEPVIVELERTRTDVLVVSHQAVLRCLYAYFIGRPASEAPHLSMPLHTVIELVPRTYGCDETRHPLAPGASWSDSTAPA